MEMEVKTPQINFDKMRVFLIKTNIKYQHMFTTSKQIKFFAHMATKPNRQLSYEFCSHQQTAESCVMFPMGIIYNNHRNDHVFESSSALLLVLWLLIK